MGWRRRWWCRCRGRQDPVPLDVAEEDATYCGHILAVVCKRTGLWYASGNIWGCRSQAVARCRGTWWAGTTSSAPRAHHRLGHGGASNNSLQITHTLHVSSIVGWECFVHRRQSDHELYAQHLVLVSLISGLHRSMLQYVQRSQRYRHGC